MDDRFVRTASQHIEAGPDRVFALLADPHRHPDIDGSGTVRRVRSSDTPLEPGSTFEMHMRRGFGYTTRSVVVDLVPGRTIAWQTRPRTFPLPLLVGGRVWRYDLVPDATGTLVTETWDITTERNRRLVSRLADQTQREMAQSLERLERLLVR